MRRVAKVVAENIIAEMRLMGSIPVKSTRSGSGSTNHLLHFLVLTAFPSLSRNDSTTTFSLPHALILNDDGAEAQTIGTYSK